MRHVLNLGRFYRDKQLHLREQYWFQQLHTNYTMETVYVILKILYSVFPVFFVFFKLVKYVSQMYNYKYKILTDIRANIIWI